MEGKTHILGGLAVGAFYLQCGGSVPQEALFLGSCAVGALIPDIDHTGSSLGRKIPFLDNLISAAFGHRTFTHSLLLLFLTFFLFTQVPWPQSLEFGIWLGMASHMALDALTKQGIKFFWPFKIDVRIPWGIRTGGAIEQVFFTLLVVYIGYCGYQLYL